MAKTTLSASQLVVLAYRRPGTHAEHRARGHILPGKATIRIQFQWMKWRQREIGKKKPATPLGQTKASVEAAFRPYCGENSPSDGRPIIAMSQPGPS
ncbi:hypothetical protein QBC37DRAFT_378698 [Rhypophila decipiens]|uniref:Uncharacterized protein n=1 Tax=Rhypophila decipiens TaxID=261697 RepID=A0AAN7B3N4_9PEZI|nr:hypothetical protein QBC37DRAFT_378698 [Rhypophila decipiens]